jgi:hypothetical protein
MKTFQKLKQDMNLVEFVSVGGMHQMPEKYGYVNTGEDSANVSHYHHPVFGHVAKVNRTGAWSHQTMGLGIPDSGFGAHSFAKKLRKIHGTV